MNEQKSLLTYLGEALDRYRAARYRTAQEQTTVKHPNRLWWLGRQVVPNIGTLLVVVVLLLTVPSLAAPLRAPALTSDSTTTISYQGRLADSSGDPVTTSGVGMQFRLYNTDTGGSPLWEETHAAVPVEDGLFHVLLGSTNPIPVSLLANNNTLWLGITVGSDSEMVPREQIASVPYAMVAGHLAARGSGLIQTWDHSTEEVFDATGSAATRITFDTGIDVEVPNGTTQYYLVIYQGRFGYHHDERTGTNDKFYGYWTARLVDGGTVLASSTIVQTGYRMRWDAVGADVYWYIPYSTSWIVELDSGVHSLDIAIWGYSDATMDYGRVTGQSLKVFPLP